MLPTGYVWYTSRSGFRVAAPRGWGKIQEDRVSVTFCAPGKPPLLGAKLWTPADPDLAKALQREEERAKLGNYKRLSMEVLPGQQGAVVEYTFTDPKMGRMHGLDRVFVASGRTYLVQWRTLADEWTANLGKLGVATAHFRAATGS